MPKRKALVTSLIAICSTFSVQAKPPVDITLAQIGRFETGVFLEGAAEIVAFDAQSEKLFVVNAQAATRTNRRRDDFRCDQTNGAPLRRLHQ